MLYVMSWSSNDSTYTPEMLVIIGPTIVWFPVLNQARATEDWDGCFSSATGSNKTAEH